MDACAHRADVLGNRGVVQCHVDVDRVGLIDEAFLSRPVLADLDACGQVAAVPLECAAKQLHRGVAVKHAHGGATGVSGKSHILANQGSVCVDPQGVMRERSDKAALDRLGLLR